MDGEVFFKTGVTLDSLVFNVGKTIINHHLGMVTIPSIKMMMTWGIVYYCFTHINVFNLLLQPGISVLIHFLAGSLRLAMKILLRNKMLQGPRMSRE